MSNKYKYRGPINVGDRFEDMKEGGIIEVINIESKYPNALDITIDGDEWEYGCTKHYIRRNCVKVTDE